MFHPIVFTIPNLQKNSGNDFRTPGSKFSDPLVPEILMELDLKLNQALRYCAVNNLVCRRELILRVWAMSTPRPTRRFELIPPLSLRRRRRWTRSDGLGRASPTHNDATASNKSRPPSSEPKRPRSKKFCVRLYIFGTGDHPLYCSI